jgi:endoglucanase
MKAHYFNRRIYLFLIPIILGSITDRLSAQGFLKAEGPRIVNAKGENVLLRGFGLGGWMLQEGYMLKVNNEGQQHKIRQRIEELVGPEKTEQFYRTWLANHTRKIDIDSMKAWGFNSVRLPMHYNLYTLPIEKEPVPGAHTWLEKGFEMTDQLLDWCKRNQLYLILDLHAAPGGQGTDSNISDRDPNKPSLWESEANKAKTIALWRKLAERYRDEEWIGAYDVLNEPNWGFEDYQNDKNGLQEKKNEPLKKLYLDITAAIREVDKKHIIVIEGNGWGNNYNNMLPLWDNNMVLSYHKYWNYNDVASIQHMLKSRETYNVPVWLGETGENSNVWFVQAVKVLEEHNIGWAWWPLKKLGSSNPLEVRSNPAYDAIVNYWNGAGAKPDAATAWKGLQQVGEDLKLENNIYHKDVIDALIRQPHTDKVIPFVKHMLDKQVTIRAVDYDMGKNGIAYFDKDTANYWVSQGPSGGNKGRVYRNDAVDIKADSLSVGSYIVSDFEPGEWLQYTVDVKRSGKYAITCDWFATTLSSLKITVQNENAVKTIHIDEKTKSGAIALGKGPAIIRILVSGGTSSFRSITIK